MYKATNASRGNLQWLNRPCSVACLAWSRGMPLLSGKAARSSAALSATRLKPSLLKRLVVGETVEESS